MGFGGMGSWNDIGRFGDKKENERYEELSAQLYALINSSIMAAMNTSLE